ncbi:Ras-related protein [Schistosoma japonicum]|uniref:Ras-related protein n=1 Tax=Schistosoma japonicum TaxID=6182 RepID=A0A4Z2DCM8_SCHJA|nr:Ras-related protein [Schistosoma japonicum]
MSKVIIYLLEIDTSVNITTFLNIKDRDSFIKASDWIKEIRAERSSKTLVFLVGNKVDLEDERCLWFVKYYDGALVTFKLSNLPKRIR